MSLRITVNSMEQMYNSFDAIDYNTLAYGDVIQFSVQTQQGFFTNTQVHRHIITSVTADEIAEELRTFALANNIPVPEISEMRPLFTMGNPMPVEFVGYSRLAAEGATRAYVDSVTTTTNDYEYVTDDDGNTVVSINGMQLTDATDGVNVMSLQDGRWTSDSSISVALNNLSSATNEDIQVLRQEMSELREEIERLKMLLLEN